MADSKQKRKERPSGDSNKREPKRRKGGTGGKWQTPHQKEHAAASRGVGKVEAGDVGIWATCARHMEGKATAELKSMLEDRAHRFYGIVPKSEEVAGEDAVEDIEAALQREVAAVSSEEELPLFSPVHLDLDCVLFFKTRSPIDPVAFVHRICEELVATPGIRRMRYINRLTPNTMIGRATEKDVEELGRAVLKSHFQLSGNDEEAEGSKHSPSSYAIRPTIRAHTVITRDALIKQVAQMVDESNHKVNLTSPDKVILIDIYQSVCGMSVVDGEWETLKRYNLAELYKLAPKSETSPKPENLPASAATNDP